MSKIFLISIGCWCDECMKILSSVAHHTSYWPPLCLWGARVTSPAFCVLQMFATQYTCYTCKQLPKSKKLDRIWRTFMFNVSCFLLQTWTFHFSLSNHSSDGCWELPMVLAFSLYPLTSLWGFTRDPISDVLLIVLSSPTSHIQSHRDTNPVHLIPRTHQ